MSDSRFVHGTLFLKAFSLLFSWNALMGTCHFFASKSGSSSPFIFDYLIMIFVSIRFALLFVSNYLLTLMSPFALVIASSLGTVFCFVALFLMSAYELSSTLLFILLSILVISLSSFFALTSYLGVFRFIADLPSTSYVRMMSVGFGVASVLTSAMRLGSALLFPPKPGSASNSDAAFYFTLATLICSVATVLFYQMRHCVERLSASKKASSASVDLTSLKPKSLKQMLSTIWLKLLCIYTVSLQIALVAPSFFYLTTSSSELNSVLFTERAFPLLCLLIYSVFDFLGRLSLKLDVFSSLGIGTWSTLTFLRFPISALLLVGNMHPILQPDAQFTLFPMLYKSDAIYLVLITLMGLTGGAISTIMLMTIPSSFEHPAERKKITTWMVGIQSLGFLTGTYLSFGLKYLLYSSITVINN